MSGPPFPANGSAIVAENLSRKFGAFVAVNDVSFRVEKGEIFGFLGPNGSGKTTVIKMLTGLLPLSGGNAHVEGLDVRTDAEEVRERIGYMSQNFSLYNDLTVIENLTFYGRIYSLPADQLKRRINEIVEVNGLVLTSLAMQENSPEDGSSASPSAVPCFTNRNYSFSMNQPRHRPRCAPPVVGSSVRAFRAGHHFFRHNALHGRSRTLQPCCLHLLRQTDRRRHAQFAS